MNPSIDAASLEILKNALSSIADEMALVVMRTAYSPIVRDSMDFSTAVFDYDGNTIAQGLTLAIHLGACADVMRKLVAEHGSTMREGDMFILNDPYTSGGMHLPDVYVVLPIFFKGAVIAYSGTIVHHADIGGMAPGSMALGATELFQEGIRIPLVKLAVEGKFNEALLEVLALNSRMPVQLRGDLRAQIAACQAGEKGMLALLEKHGIEKFKTFVGALHSYAERLTRAQVSEMPDGVYTNVDYIDGLGEDASTITFKVSVTIQGSNVTVDWTGTSPQVKGAINCPIATTNSVAYAALRCAIGVEVPNCEGFSRVLTIKAESGSIVHPVEPAACAARGVLAYRMFDVLHGAFAKIVPERMPALGEGGPSVISLSGYETGARWLITDGVLGSWGGKSDGDGADGISSPLGNMSNQPIELIEARLPLKIVRYGFVKDSGGAGEFRGGMAMLREYQLLSETADLGLRSDRRKNLPSGLQGAMPGSPSLNVLATKDGRELLPVMPTGLTAIQRGDSLLHIAASAGGYGDPLKRAADKVQADVIDDRISAEYARDVYGVVLESSSFAVDASATSNLRARLADQPRQARLVAQMSAFVNTNELDPDWVSIPALQE